MSSGGRDGAWWIGTAQHRIAHIVDRTCIPPAIGCQRHMRRVLTVRCVRSDHVAVLPYDGRDDEGARQEAAPGPGRERSHRDRQPRGYLVAHDWSVRENDL